MPSRMNAVLSSAEMKLLLPLIIGILLVIICGPRATSLTLASAKPIPPPAQIERFTLGYNENMADSLWIRVIQDIDYCDTTKLVGPTGRSELCHSNLGWTYQMLDAITRLTPKFRMPYNHGATSLSIAVGDKEGARRIYERGIENFPNDWSLQFRAAYHYLYELEEPKHAADLLVQAGKNGAPGWVYALAARVYTKEGQTALAKSVLEDVLKEDPDAKYAYRLRQRLDELEKTSN